MNREIPTITFSDEETARQTPAERTIVEAVDAFRSAGALRLHRAFPAEVLDALDEHYRKRYSLELRSTKKKDRRPLFTVDVEGPFNTPAFYANPLFFPIVERLLGQDCILGACSSVVSFPGAPSQHTHRDSLSLFGDYAYDVALPPYALTVLMPLVDATIERGSTEVWPETHREPVLARAIERSPVHPTVPRGSVMMTDSRVVHRGAENRSNDARPLIYNSYHRHWFRDYFGYGDRPPVAMSPFEYAKVPRHYRRLFSWRFDRYWKVRLTRQADRVVRNVVPAPLLSPAARVFARMSGLKRQS
jgi:hypothetical protein